MLLCVCVHVEGVAVGRAHVFVLTPKSAAYCDDSKLLFFKRNNKTTTKSPEASAALNPHVCRHFNRGESQSGNFPRLR